MTPGESIARCWFMWSIEWVKTNWPAAPDRAWRTPGGWLLTPPKAETWGRP